MHGRPRKPPRPEEAAASAGKAVRLRELQSQLLHNHQSRIFTTEGLEVSAKLLEINPEVYTAWNYRKLALQHNLDGVADAESVKSAVAEELRVVEMALRRNPKAYGAWYHRKWLLSQGLSPIDFEREFRLLDQLLKADARNFHGWNYRRFVAKLKNVADEEELKFTMKMIDTNFSNYSAWHNRSVLLCHLLNQKAQGFDSKENTLTEEYELVRQALFTDPSDQSGWFYHLWLLDQTVHLDDLQLISSWPAHETNLLLCNSQKMDDHKLPSSKSTTYSLLYTRTFPIILYFNKSVKDVNSSTITVNSTIITNEDLFWRPLSTENSAEARCWMTFVKVPDEKCSSSGTYLVEVGLCQSKNILSVNVHPMKFTFTVTLSDHNLEQTKGESFEELFTWNSAETCHPQESPCMISFEHLRISQEHEVQGSKWSTETLYNEMELFKELSDEDSKFVKLTLARLLVAHDLMVSNRTLLEEKKKHSIEVLKLCDGLMMLDPPHRRYYEDEWSLVLMDQLTSDKESLIKRSWYFNKCTSNFHQFACLLNKLSLTRLGSAEHLLWVQILDLSHNKLRSIAGIEALQLIVCLNLSNNQIGSFTALEPLKLLGSLRVLNVSFNEIGAHAVDTTRYLCSSPLSHNLDKNQMLEECQKENIEVGDNWEGILFLKALHLTQLDIKGNAVANEKFKVLAMKLLPSLKWLDGHQLR